LSLNPPNHLRLTHSRLGLLPGYTCVATSLPVGWISPMK
jgi:hypothetical protein